MPDGYSVDLEGFKQSLTDHLDPAVEHFAAGADAVRPLRDLDMAGLLGADQAGLNVAFAVRATGVHKLISQSQDQLRDSLRGLDDALWEAYRVYSSTEQAHTDRLHGIGKG
ncbi:MULTISPECIES: hypothetical protein [Amycolatopsis]|uniref:hypothetical protein n=1 Tax=Amycolatopsis TaxID=1813 RepID=UPI00055F94BA|nr:MULTISPECIES: hypothetical protein [Amycolatopsis]MCG3750894.1 hypothetical protein [Amycolatopsis sp. Poz14]